MSETINQGDRIAEYAMHLRDAYKGAPIPSLRNEVSAMDTETAYAIQMANTEYWKAAGRKIAGHKIGLTAKVVQAQLGVDQPDYGVLFEDMELVDGGVLEPSHVIQPKAEAEIALILGKDLNGPDIEAEDVLAATQHVVAAIEIVDSRVQDWNITFADTVADNGSSAFYVLGTDKHPIQGLDLYTCGMALEVNGEIASVGAGAACLKHPLNAAAWLARTVGLKAGQTVLTGALGPMVAINPGDHVVAKIGGVGSVSFSFGART